MRGAEKQWESYPAAAANQCVIHGRVGLKRKGAADAGFSDAGAKAVSPEVREAKVVSGPRAPSASGREPFEVTHPALQARRGHRAWKVHERRARKRTCARARGPICESGRPFVGEKAGGSSGKSW